jgi:hypothetical protein
MVIRTRAAATKTAARTSTAPAKKAATPVRRAVSTKAAPPAKKAAAPAAKPARTPAQKAALEKARAARAATAAAEQHSAPKHPSKQPQVTEYDVLRAYHTWDTLYRTWKEQEGINVAEALDFVAPIGPAKVGRPEAGSIHNAAKVAEEDRVADELYDKEKVIAMPVAKLRQLAADLGLNEQKFKSGILEELEEKGYFRAEGDSADDEVDDGDDLSDAEEDEDESDDESDEDEELVEETLTRADLKKMNLKQLQEIAEANELDSEGLDKDEIIEALLADEEEDEEEEGEDEEEDEEEGEEDEEQYEEVTPEDLPKLSLEELLDLADTSGIKIPAAKKGNKKAVIEVILSKMS